MERMELGKIARAYALICACAFATAALAETETEMAAIKQSLELEKLKLSVEKDRAELYKWGTSKNLPRPETTPAAATIPT